MRSEEHAWLSRGRAPFAGKYAVERVLGQGGMGVVFEARHIRLGQRVAIKVLGSALRDYPELVERFEREARAAGSLTSAHAVRVFDIDATEDGTPFIVMELLSGRDLSSIVEKDGPQPVGRTARWLIEACDAIAEAHRLGIVHRDIKPSNLFLSQVDGRETVKVLDFGIAKRVSTGEAQITQAVAPLGTPHYMSPEQVRCAKDVDARTDVWSLGVTLYEMLCGAPPFAHESSSACIAAIAADPVPDPRTLRPELGDEIVAVIMKALAKNADERYQSVAELVAALMPFVEGELDAASKISLFAPSPSACSIPIVLDIPARPQSRPDRTLATLSQTAANLEARDRKRSRFAMVAGVALGMVALVVTPKLVPQGADAASSASLHSATVAAVAAPLVVDVAPAVAEPSAPAPAPAPEPEPVVAAPEASAVAPAPHAAPTAPVARTSSTVRPGQAMRKSLPPAPPAPPQLAIRGAHGGLSSPGF